MKKLTWLKYGETVTETRMKEAKAAGLPAGVMVLLWVNHTINAEDMAVINEAMKPATRTKKKP